MFGIMLCCSQVYACTCLGFLREDSAAMQERSLQSFFSKVRLMFSKDVKAQCFRSGTSWSDCIIAPGSTGGRGASFLFKQKVCKGLRHMLGITVQSLKSVTGNQSKLLGSVIFSNVKNVELFLKKCRTCFCRGAAVARTGAAEVEIAFLLVLEFLVLHDAILWHEDASPNTRCQLRCCVQMNYQSNVLGVLQERRGKGNPIRCRRQSCNISQWHTAVLLLWLKKVRWQGFKLFLGDVRSGYFPEVVRLGEQLAICGHFPQATGRHVAACLREGFLPSHPLKSILYDSTMPYVRKHVWDQSWHIIRDVSSVAGSDSRSP